MIQREIFSGIDGLAIGEVKFRTSLKGYVTGWTFTISRGWDTR
jgi:hypothetical protein